MSPALSIIVLFPPAQLPLARGLSLRFYWRRAGAAGDTAPRHGSCPRRRGRRRSAGGPDRTASTGRSIRRAKQGRLGLLSSSTGPLHPNRLSGVPGHEAPDAALKINNVHVGLLQAGPRPDP